MTQLRRVAVTGLGAISSLGADVPATLSAIERGDCGIAPLQGLQTDRLSVPIAAEIRAFVPEAHFDRRQLLMLDRSAQLALVAAREALAGAPQSGLDATRCGVVVGASIGQTTLDAAYLALYGENARRLPPMTVPRGMPSAAASHIAMEFGMQGPCFATASACASSAHAVGLAAQMIRAGSLDLAVCGGTDASICLGYLKAWEGLRVLSGEACRPFSRDRSGLVIGEAAGLLVLEPWERARDRGAPIHAEFLGFGMGADAGDLTAPSAEGAARAMRAAMADAQVTPAMVDYINAHGTGTRLNDRTETAAIRAVFGAHADRLAVSSSKSLHGHCLNAAGGLEAVVTVLALREGLLPPTLGYREIDPDCDLDCVPNAARRASIGVALSNSFAFGGLNAVLAFGRAA